LQEKTPIMNILHNLLGYYMKLALKNITILVLAILKSTFINQ